MSKSCPLISILTPTWNRAEYLERVWSRIDSQTYRNIEWIVANDGSSDNTQKVIDGLAKQSNFPITFINASMRVGKPRMDNELMNHANGDFLIWNDSDDYLLPDALETLIGLWNDIPIEEREGYLGVMALCSDPQGRLQTHGLGNGSKRLDTTWEGIMANEIGDAAIMCRSDIVKDKRFLEVDFLITESSFWQNIYKNKRVVL